MLNITPVIFQLFYFSISGLDASPVDNSVILDVWQDSSLWYKIKSSVDTCNVAGYYCFVGDNSSSM